MSWIEDFKAEMPDPQERIERLRVVREVNSWVRTPYHHMARVKGPNGGCDCATLLTEVYHRARLVPRIELEFYPPDWHLHRSQEKYIGYVLQWSVEIPIEEVRPGDIVLWKYGRAFGHGGIVIPPGWPYIVHSEMQSRMVVQGQVNIGQLGHRPCRAYTLWRKDRPSRIIRPADEDAI
jgi:cell wall-associated NlpC family hydrolase